MRKHLLRRNRLVNQITSIRMARLITGLLYPLAGLPLVSTSGQDYWISWHLSLSQHTPLQVQA
jgi:hypothetical protein